MNLLPLDEYDNILTSASAGKDSSAMALYLKELGAPIEKMELWHQAVDGRADTHTAFFDWPSTEGYMREFAKTLGIRLGWQWRANGFFGELYRENALTGDVYYQYEGDPSVHRLATSRGNLSTRRKFPAKTADLSRRWCSAALKIDVARRVISNEPSLRGTLERPRKILWLTGERREESPARAKMKEFESHPANTKSRIVHYWRPMLDWKEDRVWDILKQHHILPHPVYFLGFPRLSCRSCIFFTKDHWRTLQDVSPEAIRLIERTEKELGFTLDSKFTIGELVAMGRSNLTAENIPFIEKAVKEWSGEILTKHWRLPAGAGGKGGGSV